MKLLYESAPFFMSRHALVARDAMACQQTPAFQEAVLIASPELAKSKQNEKSSLSLLKYAQRMRSRATPFGLFAAVGWGQFGDKTALKNQSESIIKKIRPDMKWLESVIDFCHTKEALVSNLQVLTHPYLIEEKGRYSLSKLNEGSKQREAHSINSTSFSRAVFSYAKKPIVYTELKNRLLNDFSIHDPEKVEQHLWQIFQQGFLLSELTPNFEKTYDFDRLIACTKEIPELAFLPDLKQLFCEYEQGLPGEGAEKLKQIFHIMSCWKEVEYPVHVDACQTATSELADQIKNDLEEVATFLATFSPPKHFEHIKDYHSQFLEKYGTRRLVPLLEVLDEVRGLGLPKQQQPSDSPLESMLLSSCTQEEVVLKEQPRAAITTLPLSFELFFEVTDGDSPTIILNPTIASPQAGSTFGRFFYLWDEEKKDAMRALLEKEEALLPEKLFVEASFLPEHARTANVSYKETLRRNSLKLHYHDHGSLTLDDIFIGAKPSGLYLFSKSLNRPILITLSTAVNWDLAPQFLKLMLDISKAECQLFNPFPWNAFENASYLPRIRYKNCILSPRRWQLQIEPEVTRKSAASQLRIWLQEKNVSSQILLSHFDNRLLLNWQEEEQFELLLQELISKRKILLFESLAPNSGFCHEFVVPFIKKPQESLTIDPYIYPQPISIPPLERLTLPGGDWLYCKIYLSAEDEERFIKERIYPFAESLLQQGHIQKWFYVRYYETRAHIRLRFQRPTVDVLPLLHRWLAGEVDQHIVGHFELATYEQEIERYGGKEVMELAEECFFADSRLASKLLLTSKHPLTLAAACTIRKLLDCFLETDDEKIAFMAAVEEEMSLLSGKRELLKQAADYDHELFESSPFTRYRDNIDTPSYIILDSLIHMHCNRLLGIDNRLEKEARVIALYTLKKQLRNAHAAKKHAQQNCPLA